MLTVIQSYICKYSKYLMYFMLIKLKYLVFLEEIKPLNGAETSLTDVVAVVLR